MIVLWALVLSLAVQAQMVNPVHFTSQLKTGKGAEAEIIFHATIDHGWHVYSTDIGDNGPIEATFNVVKMEGAELVGKLTPKGELPSPFRSCPEAIRQKPSPRREDGRWKK